MSLFFDLYQQGQITAAQEKADRAKSEAERLRIQIDDLQRKADGLTIACQALWEIVRDRLSVNDNDILAKMQEVDLRDGRADNKIDLTVLKCPSCQRNSNSKRRACIYCGSDLPVAHVFATS